MDKVVQDGSIHNMLTGWNEYGIYTFAVILVVALILILKWEKESKQSKETRILPKFRMPKFLRRLKFYRDKDDDNDQQNGSDKTEHL